MNTSVKGSGGELAHLEPVEANLRAFARQQGCPYVAVLVFKSVSTHSFWFRANADGVMEMMGRHWAPSITFRKMIDAPESFEVQYAPRRMLEGKCAGKIGSICTDGHDQEAECGDFVIFFEADGHYMAVHAEVPSYCDDESDVRVTSVEDFGEGEAAKDAILSFYAVRANQLRDDADKLESEAKRMLRKG